MIGEVWFCGGQSNMELELQNAKGGKEVLENLTPDCNVRFITLKSVALLTKCSMKTKTIPHGRRLQRIIQGHGVQSASSLEESLPKTLA